MCSVLQTQLDALVSGRGLALQRRKGWMGRSCRVVLVRFVSEKVL